MQSSSCDAALLFPPDFAERLEGFRRAVEKQRDKSGAKAGSHFDPAAIPSPEIVYTTANEKSQMAYLRLSEVLRRWSDQVRGSILKAGGMPPAAARPFDVQTADVAEATPYRGAAVWSKVLPVLLLLWALTGAFYPAVDLCAGEKERGTMETLLSSPAERSEIVLGKLVTIMLFSMVTAVLNLVSIAMTGWMVFKDMPEFSLPAPFTALWLAMALVPVSALFSAVCLALAAFARSTKEGQYYLMPVLLVTMPLAVLPMAPGVELNLGNSLIPVAGVVLLLRAMLEGNYWQALQFAPPVIAVTLGCCLLSIRWAVDQFNSETVLFRESERLEMRLWLRHLVRDRQPTPSVAEAIFCGVMILLLKFFLGFAVSEPNGFLGFARLAVVTQLVVILTPALLMTVMLTSSPRQTLLLKLPPWQSLLAAPALAVCLHPLVMELHTSVEGLYPLNERLKQAVSAMQGMFDAAPFWQVVLTIAVVPAICEELAFRGFMLSGFRHVGHKWRAIVYSAIFFGLAHPILQQSLVACLLGMVLGFVAVQTGSLLPGLLFHVTHNALAMAVARVAPLVDDWPALQFFIAPADGGYAFRWPALLLSAVTSLAVLIWFARLRYAKSAEETLQETIDHDSAMAGPCEMPPVP